MWHKMTGAMTIVALTAAGGVLPRAQAEPAFSFTLGADLADVATQSGFSISGADAINGLVPLRNTELNGAMGYTSLMSIPTGCEAFPTTLNPTHSGYHDVVPNKTGSELTDGIEGTTLSGVLGDFLWPSAVFQFDFAAMDIAEIRVFIANTQSVQNPGGNDGRVFQNYDVYISRDTNVDTANRTFVKLIDRVITANINCWGVEGGDGFGPNGNPGQTLGASLTRVFDDGGPRLASGVTSIRFVFWDVSNNGLAFWDQWRGGNPADCEPDLTGLEIDYPMDIDGRKRAFQSSVVKEIDVIAATGVEDCDNSTDDDGDEAVDCADSDCAGEPPCATVEFCNNGVDDDGDTLVDGDDPDCAPSANPCPPEPCDDTLDNNGDGLTDCDDPDCFEDIACQPETDCTNDLDDDGDTLVDCDDPDCDADPACQCLDPVFDVVGGGPLGDQPDGAVAQDDFGVFQTCITGIGDPEGLFDSLPFVCKCMDLTGNSGVPDNAIAQDDFGFFQVCATGPRPGTLVDPACDDVP